MTRNRTLTLTLTSIAFTSLTAGAQMVGGGGGGGPGSQYQSQLTTKITTPGQQSTGTFTRSVTGDFDGDDFPDVAVIQGGSVLVGLRPASNPWWLPSGIETSDLAVREVAVGRDRFVTVNSFGAHEHVISAAGTVTSILLDDSAAWTDAMLVETGKTLVNSVLEERVVGIASDARTVQVLSKVGATWVPSTLTLDPVLGADAVDMLLTDLDANQELEVAIATQSGLKFYELSSGDEIISYGFSGYVTTSIASGVMSTGNEWIAWTSRKAGKDHLLAIDQNGIASFSDLGDIGIVGSATVEWATPGESDLALSLTTTDEMYVLTNTGANRPILSLNNYTAIALGEPSPSSQAQPAVADVDADGDEDLLLPLQASEQLVISRNDEYDHNDDLVEILDAADNIVGELVAITWSGCGTGITNDEIGLAIRVGIPSASPANAVAYTVWKQVDPSLSTPSAPNQNWTTSPVAVSGQEIQVFSGSQETIVATLPDPENTGCEAIGTQTTHMYHVELQLLKVDIGNNNAVLNTYASKLLGVQTQGDRTSLNATYLSGIKVPGTSGFEVVWLDSDPGPPDGTNVGSVDEMTELPNLTEGQIQHTP